MTTTEQQGEFTTAYDLLLDERHCRYGCPITWCQYHHDQPFTTTALVAHLQTHTDTVLLNKLSEITRVQEIMRKAISTQRLKLSDA